MDAELSSIMTNLGQVRRGHIVLDPFCGTGSILLSCGLRGAFCVGTDIDIRVIRGHSQEKSVVGNFFQYKLPQPERRLAVLEMTSTSTEVGGLYPRGYYG